MKLIILVSALVVLTSGAVYDYTDQGSWGGVCNTGNQQSPIDVNMVDGMAYYKEEIETFGGDVTVNYDADNKNTLYFGIAEVPAKVITMPANWPVGHTNGLELLQVHLHWGDKGSGGSEHMFFGKHYDGEMHLVTRNLDQADETAWDAYAVFGVFLVNVPDEADVVHPLGETLQQIVQGASAIMPLDAWYKSEGHGNNIFTYKGSLTTPGCSEVVFWQVLMEPIGVHETVMNLMYDHESISSNYRDVQPLNGRHITHRVLGTVFEYQSPSTHGECRVDCYQAREQCAWSGSTTLLPSLTLLLAALFFW